ncbi:MAG TPA: hypothetical protein VMV49_11620 [Candidatus Deferrimicrobium sp.]|nr:hypothetical protein [Candidatus Deferrimicrobium sp.]
MTSQKTENAPPISRTKLLILLIISAIILKFILDPFLHNFILEISIAFVVLLPIYFYFSFRYYHLPRIRKSSPKIRGMIQCPHHPAAQIVTQCILCRNAICERCQTFKTDIRNNYRRGFRMNPKLFDQQICMDCIFDKIETTKKILGISCPILLGIGLTVTFFGFYIKSIFSTVLIIGGIIMFCLSILLLFMAYAFNKESNKLAINFKEKIPIP